MGRGTKLVVAGVAAVALSGCIGATPRDDFEAEVQARGGGLTSGFVEESLTIVAARAGAADWRDLESISLSVLPGNRTVSATIRDPDRSGFVDTFVVKDGEVLASTPLQDADALPLDDIVFLLGAVAIVPVEEITDQALAAFGEADGYVESMFVGRTLGEVTIRVDLESARRTATATFDAAGTLVEID